MLRLNKEKKKGGGGEERKHHLFCSYGVLDSMQYILYKLSYLILRGQAINLDLKMRKLRCGKPRISLHS